MFKDVVVVFGLAVATAYVNKWFVWPLYWPFGDISNMGLSLEIKAR